MNNLSRVRQDDWTRVRIRVRKQNTHFDMMENHSSVTDDSSETTPAAARGAKRVVLLLAAAFFFGLGVLGAIFPGIPTTPFLLLTSYFLVRTSPALNKRLLQSRLFGPMLTDWQVNGGVRSAVKLKAIAFVVIAVGISIVLTGYSMSLNLAVVGLALIGILVILKLPTVDESKTS